MILMNWDWWQAVLHHNTLFHDIIQKKLKMVRKVHSPATWVFEGATIKHEKVSEMLTWHVIVQWWEKNQFKQLLNKSNSFEKGMKFATVWSQYITFSYILIGDCLMYHLKIFFHKETSPNQCCKGLQNSGQCLALIAFGTARAFNFAFSSYFSYLVWQARNTYSEDLGSYIQTWYKVKS